MPPTSTRFDGIRDARVNETDLDTIGSALHHAALWLSDSDEAQLSEDDPALYQRFALAVIHFAALNSTTSTRSLSEILDWLSPGSDCSWEGVTCINGRVKEFEIGKYFY